MSMIDWERVAAWSCLSGALVHVGGGIAQSFDPMGPTSVGFAGRNAFGVVAHLLLGIGVFALARSRMLAGTAWTRLGFGAAAVGWGLIVTGELTLAVNTPFAETVLVAANPVIGLGMLVAAAKLPRTAVWSGWRRLTPLACALYVFVIQLPAFAVFKTPDYPVIATWGLCWLALAMAILTAVRTHQAAEHTPPRGPNAPSPEPRVDKSHVDQPGVTH